MSILDDLLHAWQPRPVDAIATVGDLTALPVAMRQIRHEMRHMTDARVEAADKRFEDPPEIQKARAYAARMAADLQDRANQQAGGVMTAVAPDDRKAAMSGDWPLNGHLATTPFVSGPVAIIAERDALKAEVAELRQRAESAEGKAGALIDFDGSHLDAMSPNQLATAVRTVTHLLRYNRIEGERREREVDAERRRLEADLAAARQSSVGQFDANLAKGADNAMLRARLVDSQRKYGEEFASRMAQTKRAETAENTLADFRRRLCEALAIEG